MTSSYSRSADLISISNVNGKEPKARVWLLHKH